MKLFALIGWVQVWKLTRYLMQTDVIKNLYLEGCIDIS